MQAHPAASRLLSNGVGEQSITWTDRETGLPLVVHGQDATAWAVLRWAAAHGHGIRIGLEDALALEGGRRAKDNAELVRTARAIAGR